MSSKHIETYTKALGTDVNMPKTLIAIRVLSESIMTLPADDGLRPSWSEANRAQWNVLHDTVLHVMEIWKTNISTEALLIKEMLHKHAGPMCASFSQAPHASQERDASVRRIFRQFNNVTELRHSAQTCKKGKTGRLTTVDEICALGGEELLSRSPAKKWHFEKKCFRSCT